MLPDLTLQEDISSSEIVFWGRAYRSCHAKIRFVRYFLESFWISRRWRHLFMLLGFWDNFSTISRSLNSGTKSRSKKFILPILIWGRHWLVWKYYQSSDAGWMEQLARLIIWKHLLFEDAVFMLGISG